MSEGFGQPDQDIQTAMDADVARLGLLGQDVTKTDVHATFANKLHDINAVMSQPLSAEDYKKIPLGIGSALTGAGKFGSAALIATNPYYNAMRLFGHPEPQNDAMSAVFDSQTLKTAADYYTPDARTTSKAGSVLYGVGRLVGSIVGAAGNPEAMALTGSAESSEQALEQGATGIQAAGIGSVSGVSTELGMRVAPIGATLPRRVATGAAGFTAINTAATATQQAIAGDNHALASQYDPWDPASFITNAASGAIFGAMAHPEASKSPLPSQIDAALTLNNAKHFQVDTAPGKPADVPSAIAHQDALETAFAQAHVPEPVQVAGKVAGATFIAPEPHTALPEPVAEPAMHHVEPSDMLESVPIPERKALAYNAPELNAYAASVEQKYGLPDGLINALKNAGERSNSNQISPAGARGVMQFMPENLKHYGVTDASDPVQMLDAAGRYLRDTMKAYDGNIGAMIADYNGGPKQAARVLQGLEPMAPETAKYLKRVMAYIGGDHPTDPASVAGPVLAAHLDGKPPEAPRSAFEQPDILAAKEFQAKARDRGVSPEIAAELTPEMPRDHVTGYFDGRLDQAKSGLVERAQAHVEATDEPSYYVSADIANLSGLNAHAGNDAGVANAHFKAFADILHDELKGTGGDVVPMRTGGDELGAVVINADAAKVDAAIGRAHDRVQEYAQEHGLSDVPHPKGGKPGVGLHIGAASIHPGVPVADIFSRADRSMGISKTEGRGNVRGSENRATQARGNDAGTALRGGQDGGAAIRPEGARHGTPTAEAKAGQARQKVDPDATAALDSASRIAAENPDHPVTVGSDEHGQPVTMTASEVMAQIQDEHAAAVKDAQAYDAAINCYMRRG